MCLIITSPNGRIPRTHLTTALCNNPDGWGFAVSTGRSIWIRRGLHSFEFWPNWIRRPRGSVVFHSRIRTHGALSIDNCQPLLITPTLALAHNGIIENDLQDEILSDTRVFIRNILSKPVRNNLLHPSIQHLILRYIGSSKLVFFTRRSVIWITNQELGKTEKSRWYSNQSFKPRSPIVITDITSLNDDRRIPTYYQRLMTKY